MDVKPLNDFRETVELVTAALKKHLKLSMAQEIRLDRAMRQLNYEFDQLFIQLTGYAANDYYTDDQGDTVMLNASEATNRVREREEISRLFAKNQMLQQPYAIYTESETPKQHRRLIRLFGLIDQTLKRRFVMLTSDRPTNVLPKHDRKNTSLSEMMYMRNRRWLNVFAGKPFDMTYEMQKLWKSYGERIAKSPSIVPDDRSNEINIIDALFEPVELLDYSPEELAVAVKSKQLLTIYREFIAEQVRHMQRSLSEKQAIEQRDAARLIALQNEGDALTNEYKSKLKEIKKSTEEDRYTLTNELLRTNADEHHQARRLCEMRQRDMLKDQSYRTDNYLFLINTYLDRETIFLNYLANVLKQRRDHKRLNRMTLTKEFHDRLEHLPYVSRNTLKRYLNDRDRLLNQLYELEYPRYDSEAKSDVEQHSLGIPLRNAQTVDYITRNRTTGQHQSTERLRR